MTDYYLWTNYKLNWTTRYVSTNICICNFIANKDENYIRTCNAYNTIAT